MDITAAAVRKSGGPFAIEKVEIEGIRPDEVLVRVVGTGLCHTDLVCALRCCPRRCRQFWAMVGVPRSIDATSSLKIIQLLSKGILVYGVAEADADPQTIQPLLVDLYRVGAFLSIDWSPPIHSNRSTR